MSGMRSLLVRLYPKAWRRRYGAEFAAVLSQRRLTPGEILDIALGALDAHERERRRRTPLAPAAATPGRATGRVVMHRREEGMARRRRDFACSFCGKTREQASRLIAGPDGVYICAACVALCNEILAEDATRAPGRAGEHGEPVPRAAPRGRHVWWRRLLRREHRHQDTRQPGLFPA